MNPILANLLIGGTDNSNSNSIFRQICRVNYLFFLILIFVEFEFEFEFGFILFGQLRD